MNRILLTISVLILSFATGIAQYPGWQQAVDYTMDITVDTAAHQYSGSMKVVLRNNSPEALAYLWFQMDQNRFRPDSDDSLTRTFGQKDRITYRT
ncbi:MAG: M1 family peptidase, partial [Flavobacteriales bacterium]